MIFVPDSKSAEKRTNGGYNETRKKNRRSEIECVQIQTGYEHS